MKNGKGWKIAFLALLSFNLLLLAIFLSFFFLQKESNWEHDGIPAHDSGTTVQFETDKENLERLVNYYIQREYASGPISYAVRFQEEVELYGKINIFDEAIGMKMTFKPDAMENGDLLLTQTSVSIGNLNLPVSYIMNFMKNTYHFPDWVEIYPAERLIHVGLTKIDWKNGMIVRTKEFNLASDRIVFSVHFPENIGRISP